jgi:putative membrane protein
MFHKKMALTVIALLPASLLCAQTDPPASNPAGKSPVDATVSVRSDTAETDAVLATFLLSANNNEIALARIALQKAQNKDVKLFAQQMVDEHTQFGLKLQPFAGPKVVDDATARKPVAAVSLATFDHKALVRDLGKKCLESSTKMLGDKTGAEFDRCYMRMQVGAHVQVTDMLEVFQTYASDRLRPTLEAGLKTTQAHLEHAKTLCKQTDMTPKEEKIGNDSVK